MHADNFNFSILGTNSGQRVVFLHGLMAFSANWRKIANRIEDQYQCLIYDQRGHGRSFKPESDYSLATLAEDLNKITDELGWTEFNLVGHSMGGRVAMVFAAKYPQKVKTLCIEDVGAENLPESLRYYERMQNILPTPFASKDSMKSFFKDDFLKLFAAQENGAVLVSFLQANQEEKPDGTYDWRFSKKAIFDIVKEGQVNDRWLEVSSFKMPVLLVRGENSHILSAEEYEKMLKVNPVIEGVEVKDAGHWLHYEKFAEFTKLLLDFLNRHNAT